MEEPKTASNTSRPGKRSSFSIAEESVRPGSLKRLEIPVARVPSGMWLSLPVVVLHGARPGPTVFLSAAVHGDELNGIPIIRNLIERLDPRALAGTILAVPVVNVFGIIMESRYLPDRRDLNRSFPGSAKGSLASQIANLFMTHVVDRCQYGIDFHTGSDGRTNLPQIRCDLGTAEVRNLALAFGAPVALNASMRRGSLRAAATSRGCRVLLYEAGEARRFHRGAIQTGIDGTRRVLRHLDMIDGEVPVPVATPVEAYRSFWVRARRSGLCQMHSKLGDHVEPGTRVAVVLDTIGRKESPVRSRAAGLLIGHLSQAIVTRGDAVAHIAEVEAPPADVSR